MFKKFVLDINASTKNYLNVKFK